MVLKLSLPWKSTTWIASLQSQGSVTQLEATQCAFTKKRSLEKLQRLEKLAATMVAEARALSSTTSGDGREALTSSRRHRGAPLRQVGSRAAAGSGTGPLKGVIAAVAVAGACDTASVPLDTEQMDKAWCSSSDTDSSSESDDCRARAYATLARPVQYTSKLVDNGGAHSDDSDDDDDDDDSDSDDSAGSLWSQLEPPAVPLHRSAMDDVVHDAPASTASGMHERMLAVQRLVESRGQQWVLTSSRRQVHNSGASDPRHAAAMASAALSPVPFRPLLSQDGGGALWASLAAAPTAREVPTAARTGSTPVPRSTRGPAGVGDMAAPVTATAAGAALPESSPVVALAAQRLHVWRTLSTPAAPAATLRTPLTVVPTLADDVAARLLQSIQTPAARLAFLSCGVGWDGGGDSAPVAATTPAVFTSASAPRAVCGRSDSVAAAAAAAGGFARFTAEWRVKQHKCVQSSEWDGSVNAGFLELAQAWAAQPAFAWQLAWAPPPVVPMHDTRWTRSARIPAGPHSCGLCGVETAAGGAAPQAPASVRWNEQRPPVLVGVAIAWGVDAASVRYVSLSPELPRPDDRRSQHPVAVGASGVGRPPLLVPARVVVRILLYVGFACSDESRGRTSAVPLSAGAPATALYGAVSRHWWRCFVEARAIWHGAVMGARWAVIREVFAAMTSVKVALNAKSEVAVLAAHGVAVNGEVYDPQVRCALP